MKPSTHILDELKGIAPTLAGLQKPAAEQAPTGYFENFPNTLSGKLTDTHNILEKAKSNLLQQQAQLLSPPNNYFSNHTGKLLKQIQQQELVDIAPTLASISKQELHQAPQGYFEAFSKNMQYTIRPASINGWMVHINRAAEPVADFFLAPARSLAVAASVAIMLVLTMVYTIETKSVCPPDDLLCQLDKVSVQEIDAYILNHPEEFSQSTLDYSLENNSIKIFSDADLNEALNELETF